MTADGGRHRAPIVVLLVLGVLALHAVLLEWMIAHLALSATALALVVSVVLLKHVGLLGAVFRAFRRREEKSGGED